MPGIGQSYNDNGSSYASRLATQWERQTGRKADANDPEYARWVPEALSAMIAQDRSDLQRSQAHWRVADRIATGAALSVIGAGVGSALSGAGAAGGSAEGSAPEFAVTTTPYAGGSAIGAPLAAAGHGAAGAGTVGAIGTGAGAAVNAAGRGAGAAGGGGAGAAARRYLGLTARDWLQIAGAGAGTVGALTADRPNTNPNTMTSDPNILRMLGSMQRRLDMSEPLFGSVMSMANGLLPTQYQNSGNVQNAGNVSRMAPSGYDLNAFFNQMGDGDPRKGGGGMT